MVTTLLAILIPFKTGRRPPELLSEFLTDEDFPVGDSEWSILSSPTSPAAEPLSFDSFPRLPLNGKPLSSRRALLDDSDDDGSVRFPQRLRSLSCLIQQDAVDTVL